IIFFVTQRAKARKCRENSPSIFPIVRSVLLLLYLLYCTKVEFHHSSSTLLVSEILPLHLEYPERSFVLSPTRFQDNPIQPSQCCAAVVEKSKEVEENAVTKQGKTPMERHLTVSSNECLSSENRIRIR
ncbi:hypothetical protein ALC57_06928, partial [Trachymyrmex cornetzi]